ncbi:ABC transporter permease [Sporomusa acidovorans]|uniref:Oligopeptide transport system permease protein OppB n=1 Tax=Sporomusa acidovorans (strain ATCC 49682 / DSM 3132 / Mol) TaxID=1123286 RepID=A0ABZ3J9A4_SPOA4|nr:ABC transporter permease [Sporomusa acidovorans]OZC16096.1 oligopeptide transport system permease protein OppB [Sporomusa acidovorans DSM 3132]SDD86814.1 oligopeptide transport system permease protein [Sporomusa acidovorans]
MFRYTVNRIVSSLLVLLTIISITFLLMHAIPGGPFTGEKNIPAAVLKNIEEHYRLNDPLWKQYIDYLASLAQFDLGPSFKYAGRSVNDIIRESFPVSFQLGLESIILAVLLGIPAGAVAALRQNKWQDHLTMIFATLGVSVPSFVLATVLVYVLAIKLALLPASMWNGVEYTIMPALALAAQPTAFIARLTRASMLEVLAQDYMKTARAKGLPQLIILYRHALKNALIPVITYIGPMSASILTGSFIIENIFAIPGLGRHFVTSIYNRDYTVILGVTVFYSVLVIGLNLVVDLIYPLLDPRIKLAGKQEG